MLPLVITVRSLDGSTRRYAFAESPVSIGRSPFAELQLTEPFVSRWEGTLRFDAREVTYFVLGSTNPTYVDGRAITAREQDLPIGVDSVLAIGELELRFSREPVPDADVRHKGGRRLVQDAPSLAEKTMFLDAADARAKAAAALRGGELATVLSPPPVHTPHDTVVAAMESEPPVTNTSAPSEGDDLAALYRDYRDAWSKLRGGLTDALTRAPEPQRGAIATQLQRRFPRAVAEPEFRATLKRLALPLARSEVPEVREWLAEIGSDVLPAQLQLDTGLTLERIFRLLELLTQSLAEINNAQDTVRSRWLGRAPRRSVLRSDNGRVVLAYLLNPKASFEERVAELEQTIRDAVTHEIALFKAMLEAARKVVDALSPDTLESAERAATPDFEPAPEGLWARLTNGEQRSAARLWRRLVATHGAMIDGNRYQRFFLGRMFAHGYLAAMGQAAPTMDKE
ncbi:MAG: FHA domain-containing protein [Polyangiales bacterium]